MVRKDAHTYKLGKITSVTFFFITTLHSVLVKTIKMNCIMSTAILI